MEGVSAHAVGMVVENQHNAMAVENMQKDEKLLSLQIEVDNLINVIAVENLHTEESSESCRTRCRSCILH